LTVDARVDPSRLRVEAHSLIDPNGRERFVTFLATQTFPMHRRARWTRQQAEEWINSPEFDRDGVLGVRVDRELVGFVTLHGRLDDIVTLDLRIADGWRNQGVGTQALLQISDYVFQGLSASRIEGTTREDNVAMRRVFRACGFVLESYYRSGWSLYPPIASLGYGRLKDDWQSGTVTPVPWGEVIERESGKRPE
jgi:RimJ/RimL family protein N-acetyltransferase